MPTPEGISRIVLAKVAYALKTTPEVLLQAWREDWPLPWKASKHPPAKPGEASDLPPSLFADYRPPLFPVRSMSSDALVGLLCPPGGGAATAFVVEDSAMEGGAEPIFVGDVVIYTSNDTDDVKDGELYVVESPSFGLRVRRIRVTSKTHVEIVHENEAYPPTRYPRETVTLHPVLAVVNRRWRRR